MSIGKNDYLKKFLFFILLAGIFAFLYWGTSLKEILTLDSLQKNLRQYQTQYENNQVEFLLAFSALYVVLAAVSFPGASLLTLAAGALFGTLTGTGVCTLAATIGATLAFLTSRYFFRDFVFSRWS